ncbi:putative anaphase promoting complex subunit 10 [Aspergillus campestris IBT 28561]|uniref:Anaphase promoting complex subunit 10 n=1 Tax=Aspergillus campestris (strain IBT 28561) TaxID=1392248 RepID=A0A2I1DH08_ASPC2|nr:putative anaphase promoting complex subunit 10 [Aspergillus campestris IBT 28561]PKY09162.1 putative anaphase promoting complex subunit 10 [Aspergillus campestris IBT 28561]
MPRHQHHLFRRQQQQPPATTPSVRGDSPHPRPPRAHLGHASAHLQFQTPPSQAIPQLHPSSGPFEASDRDPVYPNVAAQAAVFSMFGRGVPKEEEEMGEDTMNGYHRDFDVDVEGNVVDASEEEMEGMVGDDIEEEEDFVEEDEPMHDREKSPSPLPANLREISSLASWTVSTHKPGCGVSALRNPSPSQYWQSDGPQPHTLTLHFFKLVAVVKIRVYLDFDMDESYTPTKMNFLAGMGGNDLVEFATWEGEGPCGWVDVPLEGVGGRSEGWVRKKRRRRHPTTTKPHKTTTDHNRRHRGPTSSKAWPDYIFSDADNPVEYDMDAYEDDADETADEDDEDDPYAGNVLKAMVLQMRIMENHQNGKDTHVRGFQVFARDDDRRRMGNAPSASADGRVRRHSARRSLRGSTQDDGLDGRSGGADVDRGKVSGLEEPEWMGEPVIR